MGLFKRFFRDIRKAASQVAPLVGGLIGGPAGAAIGGLIAENIAPSPRRQRTRAIQAPSCPRPVQQPIPPGFRPFGTTFRSGRFPPQLDPGATGAGAFPQAAFPGQVAAPFFQQPVTGGFASVPGFNRFQAERFNPRFGFQTLQQPFQQRGAVIRRAPPRSAFGFGFGF